MTQVTIPELTNTTSKNNNIIIVSSIDDVDNIDANIVTTTKLMAMDNMMITQATFPNFTCTNYNNCAKTNDILSLFMMIWVVIVPIFQQHHHQHHHQTIQQ